MDIPVIMSVDDVTARMEYLCTLLFQGIVSEFYWHFLASAELLQSQTPFMVDANVIPLSRGRRV